MDSFKNSAFTSNFVAPITFFNFVTESLRHTHNSINYVYSWIFVTLVILRSRGFLCHREGIWEVTYGKIKDYVGWLSKGSFKSKSAENFIVKIAGRGFVFHNNVLEPLLTMSMNHYKPLFQDNNVAEPLMEKFLGQHYEACEMGDHNHEHNNIQWDYMSSLFFTGTILTTVDR